VLRLWLAERPARTLDVLVVLDILVILVVVLVAPLAPLVPLCFRAPGLLTLFRRPATVDRPSVLPPSRLLVRQNWSADRRAGE
jgi:hypothetical protein